MSPVTVAGRARHLPPEAEIWRALQAAPEPAARPEAAAGPVEPPEGWVGVEHLPGPPARLVSRRARERTVSDG